MLAIWGTYLHLFVQNYRLYNHVSFEFCRPFWLHPLHIPYMLSRLLHWEIFLTIFSDQMWILVVFICDLKVWKLLSFAIQPSPPSDICLSITQIPSLHCPTTSPRRTVPTLHRQKNDGKSDLNTHLRTVIVHNGQNAEFKVVGSSYLEKKWQSDRAELFAEQHGETLPCQATKGAQGWSL